LVLSMGVASGLLYLAYMDIKGEMIDQLNTRQMIHARQAASGIETFFQERTALLKQLAENEHIVNLDKEGMKMMEEFYSSHAGEVIISRIDRQGRILCPIPYDPKVIHQPVTKMEDFLQVRRTSQVVVSDVFTN